MNRLVLLALVLAGCPANKPPPPVKPDPGPDQAALAELGLLMKNDINPAFSKLSFLVQHGDGDEDSDPNALKAEIQTSAAKLRTSIARLRTWQHPPTTTKEGRDVFYAFAGSIETTLSKFDDAMTRDDRTAAASSLEQVAKTCENCHHFFRIDVPMPPADVDPDAAPKP